MNSHSNDQKRIAKNTVMLYIRMIVIMIVTLYTTRVVLNVLGETDYGIYNIVGSVVISMVFIQNSLMSATQRFLSYELGLREKGDVGRVFRSSIVLHMRFLFIIFVLLETVGLWFLNRVLDIPPDRMFAANVVYQFSIITFALNLIRIPYNSIIISYESMNIYAILSIIEAFLKLSIVIALKYLGSDKLILYGILVCAITLIINSLYISYCRKNYSAETVFSLHGDKETVKKLQGFLGWNLLGGVTGVATNEGPNYFMNYYMGVSVNAAMGIAKQVSGAVFQFASNFQAAFNPQIVKAYAAEDREYLFSLINKTSLLSFYLLFIIAFPVIICADYIFELWLVNVPQYTVIFCILIIFSQFIAALSGPLWMVAHATGDIKNYQITISVLGLLVLPASFLILKGGYAPYYVLAFQVLLNIAIFIYRLFFARNKVGLSIRKYLKEVVLKCIILTVCIIPIPFVMSRFADGFWQNFCVVVVSVVISGVVIYLGGLDKETREIVNGFIRKKIAIHRA